MGPAMQVIERTEGHYEVQKVPLGTVYRWCPESIVLECEECGDKLSLDRSESTCPECGADYADTLQEELDSHKLEDEVLTHPWRWAGDHEDAGLPC